MDFATGAVAAGSFCVCFDTEEVMDALYAWHEAYLPRTIVVTGLISMEILQSPNQTRGCHQLGLPGCLFPLSRQ